MLVVGTPQSKVLEHNAGVRYTPEERIRTYSIYDWYTPEESIITQCRCMVHP